MLARGEVLLISLDRILPEWNYFCENASSGKTACFQKQLACIRRAAVNVSRCLLADFPNSARVHAFGPSIKLNPVATARAPGTAGSSNANRESTQAVR